MRQFEAAGPRLHGAGEGTLHVAKEFSLGEPLGNRCGVERHKMLILTRTVVMNRSRDQLFARSGLAFDQNRAVLGATS